MLISLSVDEVIVVDNIVSCANHIYVIKDQKSIPHLLHLFSVSDVEFDALSGIIMNAVLDEGGQSRGELSYHLVGFLGR